ncbi:hypothetical protein ACQKCJ_04480 [Flavobacterium sp. NPDC079362]|uniref:hypothetical protein n=1 Tax=Flavobacterium sp. NPDC079362 TaxID=3390566 RepID=UPI003D054C75
MNKTLIIASLFLVLSGCQNKSKTENLDLTPIEIGELDDSNQALFSIKLNTIYGENGLEDYSPGADEVSGKIVKQLDAADGSEYYLVKLDKTLDYKERDKKPQLKTDYLIVGGRFKEQPLQKGANKTVVNIAIVKDETLINEPKLDFKKAIFAGMGEATEIP